MLFLRLDLKGGSGRIPIVGTVVLGRSATANLVLDCKTVSRIHCRLRETADGRVELEDLGSELGSRVNGRPIHGVVPLTRGDVLQVGSFAFLITDDTAAAHGTPEPLSAPSDAPTAPIPVLTPPPRSGLSALATADDVPPPLLPEGGLKVHATDDDFVSPEGWQTGPMRPSSARPAPPPRPASVTPVVKVVVEFPPEDDE